MTTEEAIRILEPETTGEALAAYECFGGFRGTEAAAAACEEACRVACAALRDRQTPAKLDRSRWEGGEYCHEFCDPIKFCPFCGRPLTVEAWAELKKREEG